MPSDERGFPREGSVRSAVDPLRRFRGWFAEQCRATRSPVPGACCLSTSGLDGYPNARFLALKEVDEDGFVFAGPAGARKGIELAGAPAAALTFWWPETERQVRVQGDVRSLGDAAADRLFQARPRASQLVAELSLQGSPLTDPDQFAERYRRKLAGSADGPIARPSGWGAWRLQPIRIEFLEFSPERLHLRELYARTPDGWSVGWLQP